jgi:hypothetical protein
LTRAYFVVDARKGQNAPGVAELYRKNDFRTLHPFLSAASEEDGMIGYRKA